MNKNEIAGLVERLNKYIADYNDAPSWGGPTMYPVPPSFAQIKTMADALTTLSARVETLEAGMSQYLKDGQTPLERMEQDQADILGLMKLLQKEKELTEKLRWALSDAVTTNTESCRERDAALHRIEAAKAERDRLRELAAGPAAWLGRWAKHVGDCQGGCVCSCGLTLAQMEAEQLIAALDSQP